MLYLVMGGNAFKNVPVNRLTRDIYDIVIEQVTNLFSDIFNIENIFFLSDKESFGDIDLLYNVKDINDFRPMKEIIKSKYDTDNIIVNGVLTSILYSYEDNYYQIDFIKSRNFKMAQFYLSYGVTGHIIGIMSCRNNIKFSPEGISLQVYGRLLNEYSNNELKCCDEQIYDNILLVNDPISVSEFFGFDYERWIKGFKCNDELFAWICSSTLFSPKYYKRNGESDQLVVFEKYIENIECKPSVDYYKELCLNYFDKTSVVMQLVDELKEKQKFKEKFNAHLIMNKGIKGPITIGKCMKFLKAKHDDFELWVKNNDKEHIETVCNAYIDEFINLPLI
jgi:hypothetical protein